MDYIHYLVRTTFGLVYPSEIEDKNYYTLGNFYILGHHIKDEYIIHGIIEEEVLEFTLKRLSPNTFATFVENIGVFIFYTEKIRNQQYVGNSVNINNERVFMRLRLDDNDFSEEVYKQHEFYFIGYSDNLNS